MTSIYAANPIAQKYSRMEKSVDWCAISDEAQLKQMKKMKSLLEQVPTQTVIRDWGTHNMETGQPVVTLAGETLDSLNRRIARFEQMARAIP